MEEKNSELTSKKVNISSTSTSNKKYTSPWWLVFWGWLFIFLFVYTCTSLVNCERKETQSTQTQPSRTAREWHAADYSERISIAKGYLRAVDGYRGETELKVRAIELERCITSATDDPRLYDMKVSEVGAACIMRLGYK